jgi:Protein of unknown function (DUF2934)
LYQRPGKCAALAGYHLHREPKQTFQQTQEVANGRDECTLVAVFAVKKEIPTKEYSIMARSKLATASKRDESVTNKAALLPPVIGERLQGNDAGEASKRKKTDSQASVLPINLEDEIRRRAYELSQHRGFASGHETEDWLQAESEVLQRYRQ